MLFAACQFGWRSFNSYCYKFVSEKKSWQAAKIHCESLTPTEKIGNLASVGDNATNMFISTLTSGEEAWIGGQQDDVGVWSWSDGRNWNFTSWATNQPNNGGQNQKFISTNFGADGIWNDNNGNSERESVCQYHTGTVQILSAVTKQ